MVLLDDLAKSIKEWNLENKGLESVALYLNQLIDEKKREFDEVKPLLVKIASVYADMIIEYYGGKWIWN